MRYCLIALVLAVVFVAGAASAAPYGPLVAGTAAGNAASLSKAYVLGMHYPFGASEPRGYPSFPGSHPLNRTAPYDEWPDPARVSGHRAAMTGELWIIASKRRSEPDNKLPSHVLVSYVTHHGHETAATEPPTK